MIKKKIILKNRLGLHIRPCSMIVKIAGKYKSNFEMKVHDVKMNGKSMLNLMQLGAMYGDEVELIADGTDEKELITEMVKLFENKFGED